ncbi:MAG: cation-transporting P-type ATPase, partial [Clostridia bacterium]|nr:cation-transporting P-type ATPase [Clostridia bacterium]
MKYYSVKTSKIFNALYSAPTGLTDAQVKLNKEKYGTNVITKKKQKSVFKKIVDAILDPMLLILVIALVITVGVNVGKAIKGLETDFFECAGIFISIALSVALTVIMEGKSQKAFDLLNNVNEHSAVKVLRNGNVIIINQSQLVVGDVLFLEAGNKIFADGRIISSTNLTVDESALTGESVGVLKRADVVLSEKTPLAEQINSVFSGTFVIEGTAKVIVTAVGNNTEKGKISTDLQSDNSISKPLQEKLTRLSKLVTLLGLIASVFVLILTVIKLFLTGNVTFDSVEDAVLSSIILIVASVPEGLPTTVAIALSLNLVKLSKQNALVRKLIATETVGCVSVICSDKTGTLTENKMRVKKVVRGVDLIEEKILKNQDIISNICINSTAEITQNNGVMNYYGSVTECALLEVVKKSKIDYLAVRESASVTSRIPFSSQIKYMQTTTKERVYIKGAYEVVLDKCNLTYYEKNSIISAINKYVSQGGRVLCFASKIDEENAYRYDGFAVITDEIRPDVFKSVKECLNAGIKVKILTGDSEETAYYVAKTLNVAKSKSEVLTGSEIDEMSTEELRRVINTVNVVARSTPKTKLKIVNALKLNGEVVAVTGDGVNDAPAIKNADLGIAMGSGSEITKEVSDIIL